jgi:uncharacterized protein (TIGR03435 family)
VRLLYFLTALISVGICGKDPSLSGAQTRALPVSKWLQAPADFNGQLSQLKGKVIILEFWATWCSPCVAVIPHMNQLAHEFKTEDVVFLSITDDDEDRLNSFLSKRPLEGIIGIDGERKSWRAFGVPSIPHTIVIDKSGRILGATSPENVTSDTIKEALAGRTPVLPPKQGVEPDLDWDKHLIEWQDGVPPAIYAIIKPIKTTTSGAMVEPSRVTADGVSLQNLVQIAYDTDYYHVDWKLPADSQSYRVAIRVPEGREASLRPYMRQILITMFGIKAEFESQEREVFVLKCSESRAKPSESMAEQEIAEIMKGKITLRRQPIEKLCQFLTNSLDLIVVDETGLKGKYDFDIPYQRGQYEVTLQALTKIGLEANKTRRSIPVLIVRPEKPFQEL